MFIGFIVFSPTGLVGVAERLLAPFRTRQSKMLRWPAEDGRAPPLPEHWCSDDGGRPVLAPRDLDRSFGGIHAVRSMDLPVPDRTLHALIGPNGAGKTTAFNVLSGIYPPDRGNVEL